MNKTLALLLLSTGVPAFASTYTISAGSSSTTIQNIVNEAAASPGNTVMFSAGSYGLQQTINLPCSNGTVYTGSNIGVVTQTHLPTAVLTSTVPTTYAFAANSNGTNFTGSQGCTIEYLRFSGTQGGIFVNNPSSGIVIQQNAFDSNDPPAGGSASEANIYVDGENWLFTPSAGATNITIVWNTFFNNCAQTRAVAWPDSGGGCASTWVNGYNDNLVWSNNTVNLTEEGLKLSQATADGIASLNADVENNNMQGNSRILIESQQDTNGVGTYSHNAFYQPYNPSYNTFELSIPEWSTSISPTHTAEDNVLIANVPVTISGAGAHYGIGLELWGAGSVAINNLFQGGNGPDDCAAGYGCSGWGITVGEPYTNAHLTGNYFSGTDIWNGSASDVGMAVTYEDGGSAGNPGMVLSPNTVVQTSTTLPTTAPVITATGSTIEITEPTTAHNVTIFYTTDGSTPAIFSPGGSAGATRVYSVPFTVSAGATAKAIASWGQGANQGIKFPSFGYVPSTVVSYTARGAAPVAPAGTTKTLVSAYLSAVGNANTMAVGHGLQFTAYGIYSDGSLGKLPDAYGNSITGWNTTNHGIAKVNTSGKVTAVASGTVAVKAVIGSLASSPWTVTVTSANANAAAAAVSANTTDAEPAVSARTSKAVPAVSAGANVAGASGAESPGPLPASVGLGPTPAGPSTALADSFQGPLWSPVTPGGGSASISNEHLFLAVPGGSNHDAFGTSNQTARVLQPIGNEDFDVAIKIDSPLYANEAQTSQGLMVLADEKNFVTFALETDGTSIGLSAHTVINGAAVSVLADGNFAQYQNPMFLRITRKASSYGAFYSLDGANWTQATSFTWTATAAAIGPFVGNFNETPASAVPVVMSVNWFDVLQ